MTKSINDVISKSMPFDQRAKAFEQELKPLVEKWGVFPWASLSQSQDAIQALLVLRDAWEPKEEQA